MSVMTRNKAVALALHKNNARNNTIFKTYNLLMCIILLCTITCNARPAYYNEEHLDEYLMQFGYLPQTNVETGNFRSVEALRNALRNLQAFANLTVTGEMDDSTKRLLKKPRCGVPDLATPSFRSKRYTLQGQRWHHTNLTWSLRTPARNLDTHRVRRDLHKALLLWQDNSMLNFTEVNNDRADILIHFYEGYHNDGYPFDGPGTVLAHAFFPGTGRGGDAHFDEQERWLLINDKTDDGTSLFNVAAHEFGHSLGLSHSSQRDALMFPWYQGFKPANEFTLPQDDVYGIQQLYGARSRNWGTIPPYHPRPTRPITTTTTTTRRPYVRTSTNRPVPTAHPPHSKEPVTQPPVVPGAPRPPPQNPDVPDSCQTSYDAVAYIRRETFIFKGKWFWRIGDSGLNDGYPVEIARFWHNLPKDFTHVDAVYERPKNRRIVFFIGNQYWEYNANSKVPGFPKPITELGLPESLEKVDGAMVWGHNGKTYFFSGTMYWRFDEDEGKVELDYPRDMTMWGGVPYNIDGVFKWKDGITYFFKGEYFYKFNDQKMKVQSNAPGLSAVFWMGCPLANGLAQGQSKMQLQDSSLSTLSSTTKTTPTMTVMFFLLCWLNIPRRRL